MNVLILGCGPAGLIAAHAAATAGAENIRILSKPRKSYMRGAQYLHEPIPLATPVESQFMVNYVLTGTIEGYRAKVYGPQSLEEVSVETLVGQHPAWDIRATYDELWKAYSPYILEYDVSPYALKQTLSSLKPDLTVSTVPAPLLCAEGHGFHSTKIWSTDRVVGWSFGDDNQVICNGDPNTGWYRVSRIHGWENTEWPGGRKPPVIPLWEVVKPTKTNCDCFPDVVRAGRYGRWKKGVLSHEVWNEVLQACATRLVQ